MVPFTFTRCIEISREDIVFATQSRATCRAFLERAAAVSNPREGGPLLLLLFSRLATLACEWLEGDLRIELASVGEDTILDVQVTIGFGAAERLFPRIMLNVPLAELAGAIDCVPQMIWPLRLKRGPRQLVLSASSAVRASTMPPAIEIDVACQSQKFPKAPPAPSPPEPPKAKVVGIRCPAPAQAPARPDAHARNTMPYGCARPGSLARLVAG